jgi:two-component system cell cycle response regulator
MPTLSDLRSLGSLPSPGPVVVRLLELASREDVSAAELARVLQTDPALTGRVLKLANSAGLGSRRVASVADAVVRIGFRGVRQLALGLSLVDRARTGACSTFDYGTFWARAVATAVACEALARHLRLMPPDDAFTLGLLHDVGTLGLATLFPKDYAALWERIGRDAAPERAGPERAVLGIAAVDLTGLMLADWLLPAELIAAVQAGDATPANRADSRVRKLGALFALGIELGHAWVDAGSAGVTTTALSERIARLGAESEPVLATLAGNWKDWSSEFGVAARAAPEIKRPSEARRCHALVVEDSDSQRLMVSRLIQQLDFEVVAARDGMEALALLGTRHFDLVISDLVMPGLDGIGLTRALRASEHGADTYLIMLTAHTDQERMLDAFAAGADDFVGKPINAPELRARVRAARRIVDLQHRLAEDAARLRDVNLQLEASNAKLASVSSTDALTGLPNRRHLLERLSQCWAAATRRAAPFALVYVDVDHFKTINDELGHDAGDIVLERVARILRRSIREGDTAGRVGGEEFVVVCPDADEAAAHTVAERIRIALEDEPFVLGGRPRRVTLSVGVAGVVRADAAIEASELLRRADAALYEAKQSGRNRVILRMCA